MKERNLEEGKEGNLGRLCGLGLKNSFMTARLSPHFLVKGQEIFWPLLTFKA